MCSCMYAFVSVCVYIPDECMDTAMVVERIEEIHQCWFHVDK